MVKYCAVASCCNGTHNRADLSFFNFPSDHKLRRLWKTFCKRADAEFKTLVDPRICSLHFNASDIQTSLSGRKTLKKGTLPAIFDYRKPKLEASERAKRCEERSENKRKLKTILPDEPPTKKSSIPMDLPDEPPTIKKSPIPMDLPDNSHECLSFDIDVASNISSTDNHKDSFSHDHTYTQESAPSLDEDCLKNACPDHSNSKECQTDLTMEMIALLESEVDTKVKECACLTEKLGNKKSLKRELYMDDVILDDDTLRFYTGLPSLRCFGVIFDLIKPYAEKIKYWDKKKTEKSHYQNLPTNKKPGRQRQLTLKEEYILVLCRLRLGLQNRHIADIFGVSEATASKIFTTWVCLMDKLFKDTLLRWPSNAEINKHYPKSFKKYPNTRVIIDATEFFIEKPTSPSAQKATWSEYKHHNTMKLLVGIAPCGAFTFISKLWSGSTSDRKITQESGLVDLLEEGDHVMADRGFNIRDLLTRKGVNLNIPPYSKGRQLSRKARAETSNIAKVRIHVERAIERLKNYKIFEGNMPLSIMGIADQIVHVCAAFCNLLPPLAR